MDPKFIGRRRELERFQSYLGEALHGHGSIVTIEGEAGLGKTRLCLEYCKMAERSGFLCCKGSCHVNHPSPLVSFIEAFHCLVDMDGDLTNDREAEERPSNITSRQFQDLLSKIDDPFEKGALKEMVMLGTINAIESTSMRVPLLIWLEDFHWADSASVELLDFLTKHLWRTRTIILLTFRPEEVRPTKSRSNIPFTTFLKNVNKPTNLREVSLPYLSDKEVIRLSEDVAKGQCNQGSSDAIIKATGGNPLFVIELTKWITDSISGEKREHHGLVMLTEDGIPSSLNEVIENRLILLDQAERYILNAASVIGDQFDIMVLSEILDLDLGELDRFLIKMDEEDQLIRKMGDHYQFLHELIQWSIYSSITKENRISLHQTIGDIIERKGASPVDFSKLSLHFCRGEIPEKCTEYSAKAGEYCFQRFSYPEAVMFYHRAIDHLSPLQKNSDEDLNLLESLADAYFEMGDNESAFSIFEPLIEKAGSEKRKGRILRKCAECWVPNRLGKGSIERHSEYLRTALSLSDIDKFDEGEILHEMAMQSLYIGDFEKAGELMERSETIFDRLNEPQRLAWELQEGGFTRLATGHPHEALVKLDKALGLFEEHPWPLAEVISWMFKGIAQYCLDDLPDAKQSYLISLEKARVLSYSYYIAWVHLYLSFLKESEDDHEGASMYVEAALEAAMASENKNLIDLIQIFMVHNLIELDKLRAAEELFINIKEGLGVQNALLKTPLNGLTLAVEAELLARSDDLTAAIIRFYMAIEALQGVQLGTMYEIMVRKWFGQLLNEMGKPSMSDEQIERADHLRNRMKAN